MNDTLPITAIVVVFNEIGRLEACLRSLNFCSQLIVIDLGSTDGSLEVARRFTEEVISWPRQPIVERILINAMDLAKYEWILSADPDEVFPLELQDQVEELLGNNKIGKIVVPWIFYFLDQPLESTSWGGIRKKDRLFNRCKVSIIPEVHQSIKVLPEFITVEVPYVHGNAIQHYWVDSILKMFEKHWRYIKLEGRSKYISGKRFQLNKFPRTIYKTLKTELFVHHGIRDGARGLFLSLFRTWYVGMSYLSLLWYQTVTIRNDRIRNG